MTNLQPKILVSIITKAFIHADTFSWLLNEINMCEQYKLSLIHDIVRTAKTITHNRNLQVQSFLKSNCNYLYILDSDNVPQPGTIRKLYNHAVGFDPKKAMLSSPSDTVINGEHGILALDRVPDGYKQHRPMKGLQEVDAVGCAGMLIHRDTFQAIEKPYFMERYSKEGLLSCGEDFVFCEKIKEKGYKIYADFDLWQEHRI